MEGGGARILQYDPSRRLMLMIMAAFIRQVPFLLAQPYMRKRAAIHLCHQFFGQVCVESTVGACASVDCVLRLGFFVSVGEALLGGEDSDIFLQNTNQRPMTVSTCQAPPHCCLVLCLYCTQRATQRAACPHALSLTLG